MQQSDNDDDRKIYENDDGDDPIDAQAAAWFSRLRSGRLTGEQKSAFEAWLNQKPAHRKAFDEIGALWEDADFSQVLQETAEQTPKIVRSKPLTSHTLRIPLALAACLALVVAALPEIALLLQADYLTRIGERHTVRLADGSSVMLNTDSAVAVDIGDDHRIIRLLKGEAYFDVRRDPERPFIVKTDHSRTRVLGTRFFIHDQGDRDQVTVSSGRVEVTDRHNANESVVLHDQDVVAVDSGGLSEVGRLDSELSTSWVDGYLVFEDAPLEEVIGQVQRYRTGLVLFKDDNLRRLHINGRIKLGGASDALKTLQKTLSLKMWQLTDWLVVIG